MYRSREKPAALSTRSTANDLVGSAALGASSATRAETSLMWGAMLSR